MATASTLADRQRSMRERYAAQGMPNAEIHCPATEKHYTPAEVGKLWGFSTQAMIRLFENEPGVVFLGTRVPQNGKQRRMFLRIPKSLMERKHEELVNK